MLALVVVIGLTACTNNQPSNGESDSTQDIIGNNTQTENIDRDKEKEETKNEVMDMFPAMKKCLVKATTKEEAIQCHRDATEEGDEFDMETAEYQVQEWTTEDKENLLKQIDNLIEMVNE